MAFTSTFVGVERAPTEHRLSTKALRTSRQTAMQPCGQPSALPCGSQIETSSKGTSIMVQDWTTGASSLDHHVELSDRPSSEAALNALLSTSLRSARFQTQTDLTVTRVARATSAGHIVDCTESAKTPIFGAAAQFCGVFCGRQNSTNKVKARLLVSSFSLSIVHNVCSHKISNPVHKVSSDKALLQIPSPSKATG